MSEPVERAIAGAVKMTIDAHGPLMRDQASSAAKRILGALRAAGFEVVPVHKEDDMQGALGALFTEWLDDPDTWEHACDALTDGHTYDLSDTSHRFDVVQLVCEALVKVWNDEGADRR